MFELPIVVANIKENLTRDDIYAWLTVVGPESVSFKGTVIFCPSTPFLAISQDEINKNGYKIKLGSQDISKFQEGSHTGEVAASQIQGIIDVSIIGHSERREGFDETHKDLAQKVENAKMYQIEPIFCIQGARDEIPQDVKIIAYEPSFAIGTNNPQPAADVAKIITEIKNRGDYIVLYGGSVAENNANSYILEAHTNGLLVGATNSLNPQNFLKILNALS